MKKNDGRNARSSSVSSPSVPKKTTVFTLLALVFIVRLIYLGLFHDRVFSGPSTQYEQAFVAMGLLDGKGVTIFREPPAVADSADPDRFIDPERYRIDHPERISYVKEVPGYGFFLAALWKISGTKSWGIAQAFQLVMELFAAWGIFVLTRRTFGGRAAFWAVLAFAFLFYEARVSVIPYKDIILLYVMLGIAFLALRIFEGRGRAVVPFALLCALAGLGYYFMPNVLLYPLFALIALTILRKMKFRTAVVFAVLAAVIVGAVILPYQAHVLAHENEPGVQAPLFWYRFWLGSQVRSFYSTEEERFQDFLREKTASTGKSLEAVCKEEFFAAVKANPLGYAAKTAKKLLYGTFLVYGNAGDAAYSASWSRFKAENPQAGFMSYAKKHPGRVLGMILGTASASILFPLAVIAAVLLVRSRRTGLALFFLHIPLYYILLHMFFHYEARYLVGTLPGYLPLAGFVLAEASGKLKGRRRAPNADAA